MKKYYLFSIILLFISFSATADSGLTVLGDLEAVERTTIYTLPELPNSACYVQPSKVCYCDAMVERKGNFTPLPDSKGLFAVTWSIQPEFKDEFVSISSMNSQDIGEFTVNLGFRVEIDNPTSASCKREVNRIAGSGREFNVVELFYRVKQ